ncbi:MAG: fumarate reductase subunit D [Rhodospirillales bacterium]|nr:MAG: fumarate reductase subunit D [Rhodospirillales bacterium]
MARSHKAPFWFLFAAGGTVVAFVLPVMVLVTGIAPTLGLFEGAMSFDAMSAFVGNWLVKIVLFGIITLALWHAAHRLRVVAHDFGIRADAPVAGTVYGLAALGTLLTAIALLGV